MKKCVLLLLIIFVFLCVAVSARKGTDHSGYYISPIDGHCVYYKDSAYDVAFRKGFVLTPCIPYS